MKGARGRRAAPPAGRTPAEPALDLQEPNSTVWPRCLAGVDNMRSMRSQALEAWVLQLVETVLKGGRVEDSRVELKADWPSDHAKSARQIAGLSNFCSGDVALWIIGLDEKAHKLHPVSETELENWWLQVSRRFSEVAPELQSLVVITPQGPTVIALAFDTSDHPTWSQLTVEAGSNGKCPGGRGTRLAQQSEANFSES